MAGLFNNEDKKIQRTASPDPAPDLTPEKPIATETQAVASKPHASDLPDINLISNQWHLYNPNGIDTNVRSVWDEFTGTGIVVGIVDEGVQYSHPDLKRNYDFTLDYDELRNLPDGVNRSTLQMHGTAVAGVIAAANDNSGTTGVAYGAHITSFRLLGTERSADGQLKDIIHTFKLQATVDVSNNSWGFVTPFSAHSLYVNGVKDALQYAIENGRDGLVTIMVFSAGNDRTTGNNANYSEMTSSRFNIVVAAGDADGTISSFSNPGSSILITAAGSNIYTTDLIGAGGFSKINYATVQGTSFAAPIVSAVSALMLDANENLGYRDVQEILAYTAVQTDKNNNTWQYNGATNWNGGGLHVSEDFGYGFVDAHAAIRLAETWTIYRQAGVLENETSVSGSKSGLNEAVTYNNSGSSTINVNTDIRVEHIEVKVNLNHQDAGDIYLRLTSPDGTTSILMNRALDGGANVAFDNTWVFNSTHSWGELSSGTWTLRVEDKESNGINGVLKGWSISLYGDEDTSNDNYIYTNEFANYTGSDRQTLSDSNGTDTINASATTANATIDLTSGSTSSIAGNTLQIENGTTIENAFAGDGDDVLIGNSSDNILWGGRGKDNLFGDAGDDTLYGNGGIDTLAGGLGNDVYMLNNLGDQLNELEDEGDDTVEVSFSFTLAYDNIENIKISGTEALSATGNSGNNTIIGNIAANTLSGGGGDDTLIGGLGNDVYLVTSGSEVIVEEAEGGNDLVKAYASFTVTENIEQVILQGNDNLSVTGSDSNDSITGNTGKNLLIGGLGNDTLDGFGGADTLDGGDGNDAYLATSGMTIIESEDGGEDRVISQSLSYTLDDNIEILTLQNVINSTGTGNALDNLLYADIGKNTLDGGAGNDTMQGGKDNDTYIVDSADDVIIEIEKQGTDLVQSTVSYTLGVAVENMLLLGNDDIAATGNSSDNTLTGNGGNNTLDGKLGKDLMIGGGGDDTYIVDNTSDRITETANGGTDTVRSSITYTLKENIENLELVGTATTSGIGNKANNIITGNDAANTLDGGIGMDTLIGGLGNDVYIVADADVLIEEEDGGIDLVKAANSYTLADNLENLLSTGKTNSTLVGNALNNIITGNSLMNTLDGSGGDDTLIGGAGNDLYLIDSAMDVVTELGRGGIDTVQISFDYTLSTNVENLVLLGSDNLSGTGSIDNNLITGNDGDNSLSGGAGADTLDGGLGDDTLFGGLGDDVFILDSADDVIVEDANAGMDVVSTAFSYTLQENIEKLTLTGTEDLTGVGNSVNNVLTGNAGDNTLDGGLGADTMNGGTGTDVYFVDNIKDLVVELKEARAIEIDTVFASISYTLGNYIENMTLTGSDDISAIGNGLANVLVGNDGNNTLNGSTGKDTMIGGAGDDTYIVDNIGDVIQEDDDGGNDTIIASVGYTLGANIENIIINGKTSGLNKGNDLNNVITGNGGNNTLDGGLGDDTLIGGAGNDSYLIDENDVIVELENGGTDMVTTAFSYTLSENIEKLTLTGSDMLTGVGNSSNNVLIGNGANNTLDGGVGADTMQGGQGNDYYLVDNAKDAITESGNGGVDTVESTSSYTLSANVENLILTGNANLNATGTNSNNTLTGNNGNNILNGLKGQDTLIGGAGDDRYLVTTTSSQIIEEEDEGNDTIVSSVSYTLGTNIENLELTGSSVVQGTGNVQDNMLKGNSGKNTLNGGFGNDTLIGGGGADLLKGGEGDDCYSQFTGNFGSDVINDTEGDADILDLSTYAMSAVKTWRAVDSGSDGNVDRLELVFSGGSIISILNYFANSSESDDESEPGEGLIETIVFSDNDAVDFAQVLMQIV